MAVPKTAPLCSRLRILWWWRCPRRRRCVLDFGFCGGGDAQDGAAVLSTSDFVVVAVPKTAYWTRSG